MQLQRCKKYDSMRKNIWPQPKSMEEKLWGEKDNLLLTGVRGGSKVHDLNSRSIKKLNAEEEEGCNRICLWSKMISQI